MEHILFLSFLSLVISLLLSCSLKPFYTKYSYCINRKYKIISYQSHLRSFEVNHFVSNCKFFSDKASGGSMDWVRYALKVPLVYTYELRGSSFHWPPEKIPEQGDEVTQMMLGLADGAKELLYY